LIAGDKIPWHILCLNGLTNWLGAMIARADGIRHIRREALGLILGLLVGGSPVAVWSQGISANRTEQVQLLANWLHTHRGPASGLPISHVGDSRLEGRCFTYDAAATALAFIALDLPGEARRIVDFYMDTPEVHRLGGVIEAVRVVAPYEGLDWSVRSGANIWLGLAACHLFRATGDEKYLTFAVRIGDFALGVQDRTAGAPTYGGIKLGPPGKAGDAKDQHFGYDPGAPGFEQVISTEATIDALALFGLLQREEGMGRFAQGRERCLDWLKKTGWNTAEKRLNRGYGKQPDLAVATDVHAWAISTLGKAGLEEIAPGAAESMVRFVEENCHATVAYRAPDGRTATVSGFDFVDRATALRLKRPPLVSAEWTFQLANAYKRLADDFEAHGAPDKAARYAQKRIDLIRQVMPMGTVQNGAMGFPYATLGDAPIGHEYRTPAPGSFSTIGAAYGILALTGYDPLRPPPARRAAP